MLSITPPPQKSVSEVREQPIVVVIGESWSDPKTGAWTTFFEELYPCHLFNFAKEGNGYVRDKGATFEEQVISAVESDEFDNSAVAEVIMFGSVNDGNSPDLYDKAAAPIARAKSGFPNAAVRIVGAQNVAPRPLSLYANGSMQVKAAAISQGVSFYDPNLWGYDESLLYDSTRVHLTPAGYEIVAMHIMNILDGNNQTVIGWLNKSTASRLYATCKDAIEGTVNNLAHFD